MRWCKWIKNKFVTKYSNAKLKNFQLIFVTTMKFYTNLGEILQQRKNLKTRINQKESRKFNKKGKNLWDLIQIKRIKQNWKIQGILFPNKLYILIFN